MPIATPDAPRFDGARCLIMGGGGFPGVHLANALIRQGAVVRAFGRSLADPNELDERVHWSCGDFEDAEAVAAAARGQEIVCHLLSGSVPGQPGQKPASDLEAIAGTANLSRIYRAGRAADVPVNILDISLVTGEMPWRPRRPWLDGLRSAARWMVAKPQARLV